MKWSEREGGQVKYREEKKGREGMGCRRMEVWKNEGRCNANKKREGKDWKGRVKSRKGKWEEDGER